MTIDVFIDNNVWGELFRQKLDLCVELPSDEFKLWITREGEIEIQGMPPDKKAFTEATIKKCNIRTDWIFGFAETDQDGNRLPADQQRHGGFGKGRFTTMEEGAIRSQPRWLKDKRKKSGLREYEADRELAARALSSVVLSLDAKRGPIAEAFKQGYPIIYLKNFDPSRMSLRDFVVSRVAPVFPSR